MAHPLALQLRNLQTLFELGVEKNTTVVLPAPLMSAIGELGAFLRREATAAAPAQSQASDNSVAAVLSKSEGGDGHPATPYTE